MLITDLVCAADPDFRKCSSLIVHLILFKRTLSHRPRSAGLWGCVLASSKYCRLLEDRKTKPRVPGEKALCWILLTFAALLRNMRKAKDDTDIPRRYQTTLVLFSPLGGAQRW